MKVFMPYLVWNTVFDNTRVTSELGPQAGAIFAVQLSLAEVQPGRQLFLPVSGLACRQSEVPRHDGLGARSLGQRPD